MRRLIAAMALVAAAFIAIPAAANAATPPSWYVAGRIAPISVNPYCGLSYRKVNPYTGIVPRPWPVRVGVHRIVNRHTSPLSDGRLVNHRTGLH